MSNADRHDQLEEQRRMRRQSRERPPSTSRQAEGDVMDVGAIENRFDDLQRLQQTRTDRRAPRSGTPPATRRGDQPVQSADVPLDEAQQLSQALQSKEQPVGEAEHVPSASPGVPLRSRARALELYRRRRVATGASTPTVGTATPPDGEPTPVDVSPLPVEEPVVMSPEPKSQPDAQGNDNDDEGVTPPGAATRQRRDTALFTAAEDSAEIPLQPPTRGTAAIRNASPSPTKPRRTARTKSPVAVQQVVISPQARAPQPADDHQRAPEANEELEAALAEALSRAQVAEEELTGLREQLRGHDTFVATLEAEHRAMTAGLERKIRELNAKNGALQLEADARATRLTDAEHQLSDAVAALEAAKKSAAQQPQMSSVLPEPPMQSSAGVTNEAPSRMPTDDLAISPLVSASTSALPSPHDIAFDGVAAPQEPLMAIDRVSPAAVETEPARNSLSPPQSTDAAPQQISDSHLDEALSQTTAALQAAIFSHKFSEQEAEERALIATLEASRHLQLIVRFHQHLTNLTVAARSGDVRGHLLDELRRATETHQQALDEAADEAAQDKATALTAAEEHHAAQVESLEQQRQEEVAAQVEKTEVLTRRLDGAFELLGMQASNNTTAAMNSAFRLWQAAASSAASHRLEMETATEVHRDALRDLAEEHEAAASAALDRESALRAELIEKDKQREELIAKHDTAVLELRDDHRQAIEGAVAAVRAEASTRIGELVDQLSTTTSKLAAMEEDRDKQAAALKKTRAALHSSEYKELDSSARASLASEEVAAIQRKLSRCLRQREAIAACNGAFASVWDEEAHDNGGSGADVPQSLGHPLSLPSLGFVRGAPAIAALRRVFHLWMLRSMSKTQRRLRVVQLRESSLREEIRKWHAMGVVALTPDGMAVPLPSASATARHSIRGGSESPNRQASRHTSTKNLHAAAAAAEQVAAISPPGPNVALSPMRRGSNDNEATSAAHIQRLSELTSALEKERKAGRVLRDENKRCKSVIKESNEAYAELLACSQAWYAELQQRRVRDGDSSVSPSIHRSSSAGHHDGMRRDSALDAADAYEYDRVQHLVGRASASPKQRGAPDGPAVAGSEPVPDNDQPAPVVGRPRTLSAIARGEPASVDLNDI